MFLFLATNGIAQNEKDSDYLYINSTYLELGGNGLWYSFNYERNLNHKDYIPVIGRIGFSYLGNFSDANTIIIPVTISLLFGKSNKKLELGGGPTLLHSFSEKITGVGALGIVAFRHQPLKGRIIYRIVFTPFVGEFSSDKGYWNWVGYPLFGISIGYSF